MRITHQLMTGNAIQYMDENLQRLYSLQQKIASGKQFQQPSDDPARAAASLTLRSSLEASQAYLDTTHTINDWMSATDAALAQTVKLAGQAMTLAQKGISDTLGADERRALALEMDQLLEDAIGAGNTSHKNQYIFAGFKTTTVPFAPVDNNADGLYDAVNYNGDAGIMLRAIAPGRTIPQNTTGSGIFTPLFDAIIAARDALNANDSTAIQAALAPLDAAQKTISETAANNGTRQQQVRANIDSIGKNQIELKSLLSQTEDINMAEAISMLRSQETVYQAVLEVGQRAISALSLFDLLS